MIRAAGAVLWRLDGDRPAVAVVHRPRYDDWSLPKGKLRDGEDAPSGAVREVSEETGCSVALGRRLGEVDYVIPPGAAKRYGPKVVEYWAAAATGNGPTGFTPNDEVDRVEWLPPERAAQLLSYPWDRTVLGRFVALPATTATLLLLRHARAGDRDEWHADDRLRPLSDVGLRQSAALRGWLPLFGPRRVFSAPRVRCVETVRELAHDLGVGVVEDELLADEGYHRDPAAALRLLLDIARGDTPAVVCSQGKVIPGLVRALAERSGFEVGDEVPSRKGSTWLLSLYRDRLVAADHYPPP